MGFQTVDDGFYSSGHPGSGSTLKNPLGIVKSTDNGKTLTTLGFEGESDFHGMAVGHSNHTIYVVNEQPSSKLDTTGLYYSTDDAKTWTKSAAEGLAEEPAALAVHPEDEKTIAAATKNGLLFSSDNGNHFETLLADQFITALKFSAGGELYAAGANTPNLLKINLTTKETTEMKLPQMDEEDAISYIAENPTDAKEIAIATYKKDVYVSKDSGATWGKIANEGISK
jgi:DNA-binding beta-propeller fold protein YncE